jgi:hypothetical protein
VGGVGEQRLRHINGSVISSLKMEGIRFFYSNSLHVSSTPVLIIRRINCINTTFGICHSM